MSSRQAPCASGCNARVRTSAPRITGCAVRLGQTGVTASTSSPASSKACIASISAFTPPEVTTIRSMSTGPCRRPM